jgi:DNA topoisomerase-1
MAMGTTREGTLERRQLEQAAADPAEAARTAGLRYVSDSQPGIRRRRAGDGFTYIDVDGKPVDDETLARIKRLAIPPAWTDVWVCSSPNGHLQATGRDARGRKQYKYHPRYREVRDEAKYGRMLAFADALPTIRQRVDQDLRKQGLPREKVLAAVVRLLETTLIRVGNEEYARNNSSFGLTTLRSHHVDVGKSRLFFEFRGKGGKQHKVKLNDRRLAEVVRRCRELPGKELFQYVDDEGQTQTIDSGDVNDYLREITGEDFTAKDFRTWAGTVLAAIALNEFEASESEARARKNVVAAIERVAERLGNTTAICRKCYVHPAIIESYMEGATVEGLEANGDELSESLADLGKQESAVMSFLRKHLEEASRSTKNGNGRAKASRDLQKALAESLREARKARRKQRVTG